MWNRYTYICTYCDALIEITSEVIPVIDPACICNTALKVTYIGQEDATLPEDVADVTPEIVARTNPKPYN
jgi:hypothetical protein